MSEREQDESGDTGDGDDGEETWHNVPDCAGKVALITPQIAYRALQRVKRRKDDPRVMYRCPQCGMWHLGSRWHRKARYDNEQ